MIITRGRVSLMDGIKATKGKCWQEDIIITRRTDEIKTTKGKWEEGKGDWKLDTMDTMDVIKTTKGKWEEGKGDWKLDEVTWRKRRRREGKIEKIIFKLHKIFFIFFIWVTWQKLTNQATTILRFVPLSTNDGENSKSSSLIGQFWSRDPNPSI